MHAVAEPRAIRELVVVLSSSVRARDGEMDFGKRLDGGKRGGEAPPHEARSDVSEQRRIRFDQLHSRSTMLSYSVPYGWWTGTLSLSESKYGSVVQGLTRDFVTSLSSVVMVACMESSACSLDEWMESIVS